MPLRISLCIVLLTGIGAIAISLFILRPKINGLIEARDQLKAPRDAQTLRADALKALYQEASQAIVHTETQLSATSARLATEQEENVVLRDRDRHIVRDLDLARNEIEVARQELAQLAVLSLTPGQAAGLSTSNQILLSRVAGLENEKDQLIRDYRTLKKRWDALFTSDYNFEPELPPVSGNVIAVDPKWQFVVLDIGAEHGLLPRGVLMISRGSKLVGKARLTRVDAGHSIADLLPGWNLGPVAEGDQVFQLVNARWNSRFGSRALPLDKSISLPASGDNEAWQQVPAPSCVSPWPR